MAVVTANPPGDPVWSRDRSISHYGGAPDKADDPTEGRTSYAWTWYQTIRSMRGDAYRPERTGLVHAENLALARMFADVTRCADKLANNRFPATSDEKLAYWVEVLRIGLRDDDQDHDIRLRAAAKFQAAVGPTIVNEDTAIERLLGRHYIRSFRQEGVDIATPPTQTFWPGIHPGVPTYALNAGAGSAWLSERCHLVVSVDQLQLTDGDFLQLMNVDLFGLLDPLLPSYASFNWGIDVASGFALDVSKLDFGAVIP